MGESRHKKHNKRHGKSAETRVKQSGRQAPQREIIRDERSRHGQDPSCCCTEAHVIEKEHDHKQPSHNCE